MTEQQRIRVGLVGYGVIGRRVADAIKHQSDMELTGVADVAADWRIAQAVGRGIPLFAAADDRADDQERSSRGETRRSGKAHFAGTPSSPTPTSGRIVEHLLLASGRYLNKLATNMERKKGACLALRQALRACK